IHLNIKKDFYSTPVFEYVDDASNFCGVNGDYQSNIATIRVNDGNGNQGIPDEVLASPKARSTILISPNPARDLLTLRSSHLDMSSITLHDLTGRSLIHRNLPLHTREAQIDLSGIALGTYIVRINCGDQVFSEKIVVTK
ncbi:MAG TPA: T9SS type A sorting domain-containing protein, partial [Sphingobacteriaceae bacterium]|nr:T9SS type A sorting domain-containing protein [Sphingobacteriaceae bacterium]